jgi:hypothetical protein
LNWNPALWKTDPITVVADAYGDKIVIKALSKAATASGKTLNVLGNVFNTDGNGAFYGGVIGGTAGACIGGYVAGPWGLIGGGLVGGGLGAVAGGLFDQESAGNLNYKEWEH